ncbi:SURF1 family cytochrome oxidase biogenesis protein [Novosphingobium sp. 9]|uniref:SURF1 family cytochrome oxidase biogenesis protein n=1 Tax=Novosphingobium sp. 9 TaxID=2025349 RepID=UPI0021B584D8|nr:SURF1 family cytochrome oxidase biogenesis protein [Novosphingobium sp. 9]
MPDPAPRTRHRLPVLATAVVLAAVAMMVWLGFWQIRRLHEKEALLARFAEARAQIAEVDWPAQWPTDPDKGYELTYRRAQLMCSAVTERSSMAGHNAAGESGMAQTARCALPGGGFALVVMGWSQSPMAGTAWQGGEVHGMIAPGQRLVADPPLAGLQPNALPDPADLPNNHLSYAIQWFAFAAMALAIYALALRKRWEKG